MVSANILEDNQIDNIFGVKHYKVKIIKEKENIFRYIVSVILLGMSGYTGKQASNLRKDEVYYRKQQLELSSIDVYLDDIPQETKILIKKELSNKIFGQAGETYKSKYDDNTNETLDKVVKLVENLSRIITKK